MKRGSYRTSRTPAYGHFSLESQMIHSGNVSGPRTEEIRGIISAIPCAILPSASCLYFGSVQKMCYPVPQKYKMAVFYCNNQGTIQTIYCPKQYMNKGFCPLRLKPHHIPDICPVVSCSTGLHCQQSSASKV